MGLWVAQDDQLDNITAQGIFNLVYGSHKMTRKAVIPAAKKGAVAIEV